MRSKCRWHKEGEKSSKSFLNLEKRHFKNGVISQLKTGEGEFVTWDKEIHHQCEIFYRHLYKSHINEQQLKPSDGKECCEGLISKLECLGALKASNKIKQQARMVSQPNLQSLLD